MACRVDPGTFHTPPSLQPARQALLEGKEAESDYYSSHALESGDRVPAAALYRAVFYLKFGYSAQLAKPLIESYLTKMVELASESSSSSSKNYYSQKDGNSVRTILVDPLYYYARYFYWKVGGSLAKNDKLAAAEALAAFRTYEGSDKWLTEDDDVDRYECG